MADLNCCMAETNTILLSNYAEIKKKIQNKNKSEESVYGKHQSR